MKMKKMIAVLLVCAVFGSSITACGTETGSQDEATKTAPEETVQEQETKTDAETEEAVSDEGWSVALVNFSLANTWRVQMQEEFIVECEKLVDEGVLSEYFVTNSNGDITKQISDMRDMITKDVDAILLAAASSTALIPVVDEAMEAGIKVISFNSGVDTDNVTASVLLDNFAFGATSAQYIVDAIGGSGKIIILNGIAGDQTCELRTNGVYSVLDEYPDIEILAETYCDYDYAQGKAAVESLLSAHPQIDAVLSLGGAMTLGAIDAFKAAGRPLVPMSGESNNGFMKVWAENLENGFSSVAPCSPPTISLMALDVALQSLRGEEFEKDQDVELLVVTDDTVLDYVRPDLSDNYWVPCNLPEETIQELYGE